MRGKIMTQRHKRIRTTAAIQQRARELRQDMTPAEELLWSHLRRKQLNGLKFRRQHPLGSFIADFYCAEYRLVIEIDGDIHAGLHEYDDFRTEWLEDRDYRLIRFLNDDVTDRIDTVLTAIQAACKKRNKPSPPPFATLKAPPLPNRERGLGGEGTPNRSITMKLTHLWKTSPKPTLSFELFPARTEKAAANLDKAIDKLAALGPDFVSVTFGAGGSTRDGSYQLAKKLRDEKGLKVLTYFACYGLGPDEITAVLDDYQALGIENVLAVRGDEPREGDFTPHPESLPHASDLVAFIKPRYDFCLGVAAYPEGHIDAKSRVKDMEFLKMKVDLGAEYIITNYCYDNAFFFDFVERCRTAGIDVPILPGVMPIFSVKMMEMLAGLCGATITDEIHTGIAALPEDDKSALLDFGVDFAVNQCRDLIEAGVPGLHIYTMDRSASSVKIAARLRDEGLL